MFKLLSENSRSVKRLIAAQICMSIFSIMVILATSQWETINFLVSVLCVCFYLFFIYIFLWEAGARAAIRKDKPDKTTGFKTSAVIMLSANLLNLACAVVYTVCKFIYIASPDAMSAVETGGLAWLIVKYTQAMYLGIEIVIFKVQEGVYLLANPLYFFLITVPPIVTGIFAYMMGLAEFSFLEKIGFKIKREYKSQNTYRSNWK